MRSVGFTEYGGPEVLRLLELEEPECGAGDVLIRVAAAGANPADALLRSGVLDAAIVAPRWPLVPGLELAGTVVAVGGAVERWRVGDPVLAATTTVLNGRGTWCELVALPETRCCAAPATSTPAEAATLPLNGLTSVTALELATRGAPTALSVIGAAGGVGGIVAQVAVARGLSVVAVGREGDAEQLGGWGAQTVASVDELLERGEGGPLSVVDATSGGGLDLGRLAPGSVVVGFRPVPDDRRASYAERGIEYRLASYREFLDRTAERLQPLVDLVDSGGLDLRVGLECAPHEASRAHVWLDEKGRRGKAVLVWD